MKNPQIKDAFLIRRERFIELLKRLAKKHKKQSTPSVQLATYQDKIAIHFGYQNWSVFHKNVVKMADPGFSNLMDQANQLPGFADHIGNPQKPPFDRVSAVNEMKDWVESKFEPLNNFAFFDSESENGFAWPDIDLNDELQMEFGDKYPFELIQEVASELELENGPYGQEDMFSEEAES